MDDPTEYAAITVPGWESMSWVEVLGRLRTNNVDFGVYRSVFPGWSDLSHLGDLRFTGYEYNFAVPGFEASQFEQIVHSSFLSDPQYLPYKQEIADTLRNHADAAVVWLGGNEFRANYGYLYDGNDPMPLVTQLSSDLGAVLDFVQAQKPGIKLVVVNLPDLGATPSKQAAHPDPAKRANVTAATILANQAITNLATARDIPVADVFSETERIIAGDTIWIGPVNLYPGSDPDNNPRHEFTRDGLHPNACLQAIIARHIIDAFNHAYAADIPQITDSEILKLIGIDPMQPYWDWVSTNMPAASGLGDDPDHDHLVNLTEFVFDLDPNSPSPSPLTLVSTNGTFVARYHPDPNRLHLAAVNPEWSTNLSAWETIPEEHLATATNGEITVALQPGESARYLRLQVSVRPVN